MRAKLLTAITGALLSASPVLAQCAMCYQNASAQSAKAIQALNFGILVLLVPPVTILGCISWAAYRRRDWSERNRLSSPE